MEQSLVYLETVNRRVFKPFRAAFLSLGQHELKVLPAN